VGRARGSIDHIGASEQVGTHVAGAADYDSDGYTDVLAARSATSVYLLFGHP
jgi:hypothetical protein